MTQSLLTEKVKELEAKSNVLTHDNADKKRRIELLEDRVAQGEKKIEEGDFKMLHVLNEIQQLKEQLQGRQKQVTKCKEVGIDINNYPDHSTCPYSGPLPFQLAEGKEILIKGTLGHQCDRLIINLCTAPNTHSIIGLHFCAIFDQQVVVLNHRKGEWGREERRDNLPLYAGQPYEMRIIMRESAYQIFVNNTHLCDFNDRLPKETVHYLIIDGDTQLHGVEFKEFDISTFTRPDVPFKFPIPGAIQPGRTIHIEGIPSRGVEWFSVDLINDGAKETLLHLPVRFNFGGQRRVIAMNHISDGRWGREDKVQKDFPFADNVPFTMQILADHQGFKIAINNHPFSEFKHRILPMNRANHLSISGQVTLTRVRM